MRGESERVPTLFFFDVGQSAQQVSFFCRLQMMLRVRQVMWPGLFFCDTGPPNGSGAGGGVGVWLDIGPPNRRGLGLILFRPTRFFLGGDPKSSKKTCKNEQKRRGAKEVQEGC